MKYIVIGAELQYALQVVYSLINFYFQILQIYLLLFYFILFKLEIAELISEAVR